MTKFLILLLIIIVLAIIGVSYVFKSVRKFFSVLDPTQMDKRAKSARKKDENVIYNKDDVVVLKGEARNEEKDRSKRFYNNTDEKNDR
jgi:uncharacterized protein (UPF0333 family)